jgi:predicted transcriptional regulator
LSNQLRRGIDILREHYIKTLLKSGLVNAYDRELYSLTLSELEMIVRKTLPPKK